MSKLVTEYKKKYLCIVGETEDLNLGDVRKKDSGELLFVR